MDVNKSRNASRDDLLDCAHCGQSHLTTKTFSIIFSCFASVGLVSQLVFLGLVLSIKKTKVSVPESMFFVFQLIFMVSFSLTHLLQQERFIGWTELSDSLCKLLNWFKHFSNASCIFLLLLSWTNNGRTSKILSVAMITISGALNVPYLVFTELKWEQKYAMERNNSFSYTMSTCELSDHYMDSIEVTEVVCGTTVASILLIIKLIANVMKLKKMATIKGTSDISLGCFGVASHNSDNVNCRWLLFLNMIVSLTFLVFVTPTRYFELILYLKGNRKAFSIIDTTYTNLDMDNLKVMLVVCSTAPFLHFLAVVPSFVIARTLDRKLIRKWALKQFARKIPIRRQQPVADFWATLDATSEETTDNSEVDNGSTICTRNRQ